MPCIIHLVRLDECPVVIARDTGQGGMGVEWGCYVAIPGMSLACNGLSVGV